MPFMTERALRDMQLIAQYSKDPEHVKFANTVAGFLQQAHIDGFPKSVSELGVTEQETIRESRKGHSVIEVDPDLPVIRNKITQESTRVRPPCANLMRVFLQSPGLSLGKVMHILQGLL